MMKRFLRALAATLCALALLSCPDSTGGGEDDGGGEKTPSDGTYIRFVNNGNWPAAVYFNSRREPSSLLANLDAGKKSGDISFSPYPNAVFYLSFVVTISDVEIPLTPAWTVESRIDENFTTTVTIPSLDRIYTDPNETLVSDVYLSVRNAGSTGFRLQRGNTSLLPEGRSGDMFTVNNGETAVWKLEAAAGMPHLLSGGVTIPFPIPKFEAGHLYSFVFNGSPPEAPADTPVTITTLSSQGTPGFPAPTGLAGRVEGGSVILSWNATPEGAYYQVYRASDALGVYSSITDNTLTAAGFTDTNAPVERTNYYKVRAYSADRNKTSPLSGAAAVEPPKPEPLPPPSGFKVVLDPPLKVQITWGEVSGALSYTVQRSTTTDFASPLAYTTTNTYYTDTAVHSGETYYYRAASVNDAGTGEYGGYTGVTVTIASGLYKGASLETAVFVGAYNLAESLSNISVNAVSGDNYFIVLSADETVGPHTLSYGGRSIGITLQSDGVNRTVSLNSQGSLFTVGASSGSSAVTLTLDENVTLQGRANNTSLIYIEKQGVFIMKGGEISSNTVSPSSSYSSIASYGSGVYVSAGSFTMNGGKISGNTISISSSNFVSSYGSGVYVSDGSFTMNGGKISGNTISASSTYYSASSYGGGVYINSGTFTMSGGEISGNTVSSYSYSSSFSPYSYAYGGGVYINNGIFTMSGGEISGNTVCSSAPFSYSYGGGVYIADGRFIKNSGSGIIYGDGILNGNNVISNGSANGSAVYKSYGSKARNSSIPAHEAFDSDSNTGWED
jgi:hypothetical protein